MTTDLPDIAVSIINYKTGDMTIAAIQSVLDDLKTRTARIVVVDNASGDGSCEQIETWMQSQNDPRLTLVKSPTNCGFSGGHNQGMEAAPDAAYYLILNSDTLLRAGFFDAITVAVAQNPTLGMIAPQLEWEDETPQISCFRFASPLNELIRSAETGPVTKILQKHNIALPLPPVVDQIDWASFACILVKGEMARKIGPMDEGYFLYFEDEEYALRAQRAGWGITYHPSARVVHFRGGSGPVKTLQATKKRLPDYYWRARTRFLRQAHGPMGPLAANVLWILGRGIAQLRRLTARAVPPVHEKEWRDIWLGFFNPLKPDPRSKR